MDFNGIIGLVSFPSFHAGAAVLLATATRNLKWFWAPFLVFNVMILIGTISEGGHYFVDVIAGCLFALSAIPVARMLRRLAPLPSVVAEPGHRGLAPLRPGGITAIETA
jgi:membrane-associated phospholipid phosphatase